LTISEGAIEIARIVAVTIACGPGKGCALDIALKTSGIGKTEVRSQKPGWCVNGPSAVISLSPCITLPTLSATTVTKKILASGFLLLTRICHIYKAFLHRAN